MPNWCFTTYKCTGRKKDLSNLYHTLKKLQADSIPRVDNGFGVLWLGCIVDKLGGDWNEVRCRGEVKDFDLSADGTILTITQETAWCEQTDFRKFLEFVYPRMKIYYQEEEPGCEIYYTNDKTGDYFSDRYILDYDNGGSDVGYEYYSSLDNVIDDIIDFVGEPYDGPRTEEGINEYLEEYNNKPENEENFAHCYLHKFEYSE